MVKILLRPRDGFPNGRIWLRSVVEKVQAGLVEAGHLLDGIDGRFGAKTEVAVRAFQASLGLQQSGVVNAPTWNALSDFIRRALRHWYETVASQLEEFEGDLSWVHLQEGHKGRPYWPGGVSGVTLDPGVDLGHAQPELVRRLYRELMTDDQLVSIERVMGKYGESARVALRADETLQSIRVTEEQAGELMPFAASRYWDGITERFASLARGDTPPSVQTTLLSLAYNRGVYNRHLECLRQPLHQKQWNTVAREIGGMQQTHKLKGIRTRRRQEAALINAELEFMNSS